MDPEFDVYADSFWLSADANGCTLTLYRTLPEEGGDADAREIVGRVRVGHAFALDLAGVIGKVVKVAPVVTSTQTH